jgi:predicted enzyme related to lactoylglutathione lyase
VKTFQLLIFCVVTALAVPSARGMQLIHRSVISGLSDYGTISIIHASDGNYHGLVAANMTADRIDIYDADGTLTHSISMSYNVDKAIGRLSDTGDTLIVYVLQDSNWVYNDHNVFDVFRITTIRILGDSVSVTTMTPHLSTYYGNQAPTYAYGNIRFDFDSQYRLKGVILQTSMTISWSELTMGRSSERVSTYIDYDLDLTSYSVSTWADDYASGFFGGTDTCGSVSFANVVSELVDDPWNSYYRTGTRASVKNCDATLASVNDGGGSIFVLAGNFIPSTPNDEFIYSGSAKNFIGFNDTLIYRWECYAVDHDTLISEWSIPPLTRFGIYNYLGHRNALLGIESELTVKLFDCETATFTDSFALDHPMSNKIFLIAPGRDLPDLFGRVDDTVYVYRLEMPTDVDSPGENSLPGGYTLAQNYPNPFNPTTRISFSIPRAGEVRLDVFNIAGQRVATLVNTRLVAGNHEALFDAHDLASGIYLYRLTVGEYTSSRKMVLLK